MAGYIGPGKHGSVTNVKVIRGVDPLIDDEAVKAVKSSDRKNQPDTQEQIMSKTIWFLSCNSVLVYFTILVND